jgi:diacylglycerol kinase (ATP)
MAEPVPSNASTLAIKRVVVIHSPRSGRSEQLTRALTCFHAVGVEVAEVLPIAALDHLPPQGERWRAQGIDCAVAAGGDGLVGGIVSHVAPSGLPLGILPLGTGNDVARAIGIPMDIEQAVLVIAQGRSQLVDIGIAQPAEQEPLPASTSGEAQAEPTIPADKTMYFAHALTIGLNVQFARTATHAQVREQYGALTYPYAVYQALSTYEHLEARIDFEGLSLRAHKAASPTLSQQSATLHCQTAQISVINAPVFWGRLQARVPGVSMYDRVLDIVVIEDGVLDDLFRRITSIFNRDQQPPHPPENGNWHARYPDLLAAQLTDIPGVHHIQAQGVKITTPGKRQDATLDGEVRGQTPMHVQVAREQLCVLCP